MNIALPAGFSFDEAHHLYTLNGSALAGCTEVLESAGYFPFSEWYTPGSRDRGTAVHLATELVDRYVPDARTLAEVERRIELGPGLPLFVDGYLQFKRDHPEFVPLLHEQIVVSSAYRVAGKFDIYGLWSGEPCIVDVKSWRQSGFRVGRGAAIQTGGYKLMAGECGLEVVHRFVLQLPGVEGKRPYRLYPCEDQRDVMLFIYATQLWWDRKAAGLLNGKPRLIEEKDEELVDEV